MSVVGNPLLTMCWSLMLRMNGCSSELIGKGINGAPTTPSNSWISVCRPPKTAAMDDDDDFDSACGFIQCFMLCQALVVVVLLEKISSGIGTSSTVSSPSSRSRLGQSFFIGNWRTEERFFGYC